MDWARYAISTTTGRGKIKMRGKAVIEERRAARRALLLPKSSALNKTLLIQKMVQLVRDKKLDGISDIRDESGKEASV